MIESGANDADLLAACRTGDEGAWSALVARHEGRVLAVVYANGLRGADAEDAAQETFLALIGAIEKIQDGLRVGAWLATSARRIALRKVARARATPTAQEALEPMAPPIEDVLDRTERLEALGRALDRLDPRCRSLLHALYGRGGPLPYKQIADELGIPVGAIGPTRVRCFGKLMRLLETKSVRSGDESEVP